MGLRDYSRVYGNAIGSMPDSRARGRAARTARILFARLAYGIGPGWYSLYQLDARPRATWPDYVIDFEELNSVLARLNPSPADMVLNDKVAFWRHCSRHGLPTVPIVGRVGAANDEGREGLLESPQDLAELINAEHSALFFKPIGGRQGAGSFVLRPLKRGTCDVGGKVIANEKVWSLLLTTIGSLEGWIIQRVVQPHLELRAQCSPKALCTLRVITVFDGKSAQLIASVLRIPTGTNHVDNFQHGLSGNLVAPVCQASGKLGVAKGSQRRDWPSVASVQFHPDTGAPLENLQLPFWDEARALAVQAQMSLPMLQSIGWDIAICDSGPVLIEGNARYDVDLMQVAHGKGLRRTLVEERLLPLLAAPTRR